MYLPERARAVSVDFEDSLRFAMTSMDEEDEKQILGQLQRVSTIKKQTTHLSAKMVMMGKKAASKMRLFNKGHGLFESK